MGRRIKSVLYPSCDGGSYESFTIRFPNGQEVNRDESDLLDGPMSDDSKWMMERLIGAAQERRGHWIDYPNG